MLFRLPDAAAVIQNPSPEELKELAARMPNARPTRFGNLNVQTEVVNRSKR
jgi:phosphoenolpyruvate carboxykinase (ATP)